MIVGKHRHWINCTQFLVAGLFSLWFISTYILLSGATAWGTGPVTTQSMIDQIVNFTSTGQIHEKAVADDLAAMLTTVNTFIQLGDKGTAQTLLDGFINTVQTMTDKLISSTAATSLIDSANSLSMSL